MEKKMSTNATAKVALVTGAAKRIGAALARTLHQEGFSILIHYDTSDTDAKSLQAELETGRPGSAHCLSADLSDFLAVEQFAKEAISVWGHIDVLINNAARFYPTEVGSLTANNWDDLINTNLRAPLFLSQALAETLKHSLGCILNLVDIYAERPLKGHPIYSISKAGMAMLTKSLAIELGPEVRVNGIAPGAILWPGQAADINATEKERVLNRVTLKKMGNPQDICQAALFLINQAPYITGQIINVDGGRTLNP